MHVTQHSGSTLKRTFKASFCTGTDTQRVDTDRASSLSSGRLYRLSLNTTQTAYTPLQVIYHGLPGK
jgi:hypothetical protein